LIGSHESDKDIRAPTFSFVSKKISSDAISREVAEDKVAISSGRFYAKRLVENLGIKNTTDGLGRCSMAH
jgi:selenocysteine lyase/cysteine desulfurase